MLFSPVIWLLLKWLCRLRSWLPAVLLFAVLFCFSGKSAYVFAGLWFSLGGYLAVHPRIALTRKSPAWLGYVCSALTLALVLLPAEGALDTWASRLIPVIGIPALWGLVDNVSSARLRGSRLLNELCSYTFFIYLSHEPLLNIFKKLPLLVSRSEWMLLASYLTVPLVFIASACVAGHFLKKWFPKLYGVYTGGRGAAQPRKENSEAEPPRNRE